MSDDRAWKADEVAYFLGISESLVRKLELREELPALPRIGRRLTFHPAVVRAFRAGKRGGDLKRIAAEAR